MLTFISAHILTVTSKDVVVNLSNALKKAPEGAFLDQQLIRNRVCSLLLLYFDLCHHAYDRIEHQWYLAWLLRSSNLLSMSLFRQH